MEPRAPVWFPLVVCSGSCTTRSCLSGDTLPWSPLIDLKDTAILLLYINQTQVDVAAEDIPSTVLRRVCENKPSAFEPVADKQCYNTDLP